jgi:hypothetical protein
MKRFVFLLALIFTVFSGNAQDIKVPSEGKAVVYIVRTSGLGALINFKYFDGEKYLGKFNYGKYLVYECDPGSHLFWSKSENIDYLEADLEAGKVYVINAEPQMGAIKAAVQLKTLDKSHKRYEKHKKRVLESIADDKLYVLTEQDRAEAEEDLADLVKKAMEKYKTNKEKGKEIDKLTPEMYFEK